MIETNKYQIAVIGGGLAGLGSAITLRKKGYSVILFEKETYPFHKVCGEYISLESWNYLVSLGIPLGELNLPIIKKLVVSAPSGNYLQQALPLGGIGISRYYLDNALKQIAVSAGVCVYDHCKVESVVFEDEGFLLTTQAGQFTSKVCCGAYGKRSNIDLKLKRKFIAGKSAKLNNYIGVKYHVKTDQPADTIALHNFENGYCGISKIEGDRYCLCYLTTADNLKRSHNSIPEMEKNLLCKNPHLEKIFTRSEFLYKQPVTISQISFAKKSQVENQILLLGDAAGMISPLCGNGMSMALQSSQIAGNCIDLFLQNKINRVEMETRFAKIWRSNFSKRLSTGRALQLVFGGRVVTNIFIAIMKEFPLLTRRLIKNTHGDGF